MNRIIWICVILTVVGAFQAKGVVLCEERVSDMTIEEKVGQMFFVCGAPTREDIKKYHIGGCILFASYFGSRDKGMATSDIAAMQKAADVPMLIGTDEEGGTVNRVSRFVAYRQGPFLSPRALYEKGGMAEIKKDAKEKARLLLSLGVNVDLAPVCDISGDPEDYIYPRTFSDDPYKVGKYVETVVKNMENNDLGCVLKHFPGYGSNGDTHKEKSEDDRSLQSLEEKDLIPFKEGVSAGASCIMVSHNTVKSIDPDEPASLSKKVHEFLREKLDYDKVIMTDDLSMEAVSIQRKSGAAEVKAIEAGNDLICTADYKEGISAVIDAIKKGQISMSQVDRSVLRIMKWKKDLNLI